MWKLGRWWGKKSFLEELIMRKSTIVFSNFRSLQKKKTLTISAIIGTSSSLSWNLNFHHYLTDLEIKNFERLMSSLTLIYLSPSIANTRVWSLSYSSLFSIKSLFFAISNVLDAIPFSPVKFLWKSKVSSNIKTFTWLVAHKKVRTNDILWLKRPYKSLSPNWCILCMGCGESIDHLFLHCLITLALWHKLFNLVKMD